MEGMTLEQLRDVLVDASLDFRKTLAEALAEATGMSVEVFDSAIEMSGASYFNGYDFVLNVATLTNEQRRAAYNAALATTRRA